MDASEIYSKRLNAKEMIFHKENGIRRVSSSTSGKQHPDQIILWPELWRGMSKNLNQGRNMNGQLKNQSSIMQEDYEKSISLTLRTRSSRKSLRIQEEIWKHQRP